MTRWYGTATVFLEVGGKEESLERGAEVAQGGGGGKEEQNTAGDPKGYSMIILNVGKTAAFNSNRPTP